MFFWPAPPSPSLRGVAVLSFFVVVLLSSEWVMLLLFNLLFWGGAYLLSPLGGAASPLLLGGCFPVLSFWLVVLSFSPHVCGAGFLLHLWVVLLCTSPLLGGWCCFPNLLFGWCCLPLLLFGGAAFFRLLWGVQLSVLLLLSGAALFFNRTNYGCGLFDGQHDSQASVGSECFASQTSSCACSVFRHSQFWSRVGSFPVQENMPPLSECRQASELQELTFACTQSSGAFLALALAWNLGYQCSHRVMPATLRRGRPSKSRWRSQSGK